MARPPRITSRRLPDATRRRLEVATAMAWESLVDTHVAHAGQFVTLFADRLTLEETIARYLLEMDLGDTMAAATRTRVLVAIEETTRTGAQPASVPLPERAGEPGDDVADGWRRFRPDVVVRDFMQRQRRDDELEAWIQLAIARAEEGVITTHVDNAITFAALLEEYLPIDRAVQHYLGAVNLSGSRAQAIYQRTMARLADVHLPVPVPRSRSANR
ncbi:MAG: hypothetical protein ACRELX_19285 [Longimicrobiales bacterium]